MCGRCCIHDFWGGYSVEKEPGLGGGKKGKKVVVNEGTLKN